MSEQPPVVKGEQVSHRLGLCPSGGFFLRAGVVSSPLPASTLTSNQPHVVRREKDTPELSPCSCCLGGRGSGWSGLCPAPAAPPQAHTAAGRSAGPSWAGPFSPEVSGALPFTMSVQGRAPLKGRERGRFGRNRGDRAVPPQQSRVIQVLRQGGGRGGSQRRGPLVRVERRRPAHAWPVARTKELPRMGKWVWRKEELLPLRLGPAPFQLSATPLLQLLRPETLGLPLPPPTPPCHIKSVRKSYQLFLHNVSSV